MFPIIAAACLLVAVLRSGCFPTRYCSRSSALVGCAIFATHCNRTSRMGFRLRGPLAVRNLRLSGHSSMDDCLRDRLPLYDRIVETPLKFEGGHLQRRQPA